MTSSASDGDDDARDDATNDDAKRIMQILQFKIFA